MKHRIVILGNCHAQYLAAALTHCFPDLEIVAVGKLFDGPIHFRGTTANFIQISEVSSWLLDAPGKSIVFRQATPMSNTKFEERLVSLGADFDSVQFPYIEFRCLALNERSPNFGVPTIRAQIRADEISNKVCLTKSDMPEALHEEFFAYVQERPCAYTPNHFDGALFSRIFSRINLDPLRKMVGDNRVDEFLESVRADVGISTKQSGIPVPAVRSEMKLGWAQDLEKTAQAHSRRPYDEFKKLDWSLDPKNEYLYYVVWRMLIHAARRTKDASNIRKCMVLYTRDRRYVDWCKNLADWFLLQERPARAAIIIANRMMKDDTRGLLLRWTLENLKQFDKSPAAKAVFKRAAQKAPNSNARLVSEVLEAF